MRARFPGRCPTSDNVCYVRLRCRFSRGIRHSAVFARSPLPETAGLRLGRFGIDAAGFDAGKIEHVIDERREVRRAFAERRNDFTLAPVEPRILKRERETGIGLTLLPTLYMRSGFGARGLRPDQRRFASTPESVLRFKAR